MAKSSVWAYLFWSSGDETANVTADRLKRFRDDSGKFMFGMVYTFGAR